MDVLVLFLPLGEGTQSSPLRYDVSQGYRCPISDWRHSLLFIVCWVFFHEEVLGFVKCFFFLSIEMIMWLLFSFFIILLWCVTLIDFCTLNQPFIPGINPTWLWHMILLLWWGVQFAYTSLRILCLYIHKRYWSVLFL